jgi:hypothetical protein
VLVEEGAKGGAEDPIVVEGGVGEGGGDAGGDAPGEGLIRTENVGYGRELAPEIEVGLICIRGGVVLKAAGFDEGKEGPAEVGFGASGEDEGDDETFGRGPDLGEEAGETGAEAGGIDDEVAGIPLVAQAAEEGVEIGVGDALPADAGDDAVEGEQRGRGGGGDDVDEGEGSEVVGELGVLLGSEEGGGQDLSPGPSPMGGGE